VLRARLSAACALGRSQQAMAHHALMARGCNSNDGDRRNREDLGVNAGVVIIPRPAAQLVLFRTAQRA